MKLKLTVNDVPDNDYITLDPCPLDGLAYTGSMINLGDICDKAEATEVLASTMLDYIPAETLERAISAWCELLRHGGKIILGGTNANQLSRLWLSGYIDATEYNRYIYGAGPVRHAAIYSVADIEKHLVANGIRITRRHISDMVFIVEGIRE